MLLFLATLPTTTCKLNNIMVDNNTLYYHMCNVFQRKLPLEFITLDLLDWTNGGCSRSRAPLSLLVLC